MEESKKKKTLTLELSGNLDVKSAPKLETELIVAFDEADKIILDFKKVTYISSSGLRVLLSGDKTAKEKGVKLSIINSSSFIMQIFEVTGFSDILDIS